MKKLILPGLTILTLTIALRAGATSVNSYGEIKSGPSTAQATCTSALRGMLYNVESGGTGGVVDLQTVCRKLASGSYAWVDVTTSP